MKSNVKTEGTNSYRRMGFIMLFSAVGGGILGFVLMIILGNGRIGSIQGGAVFVFRGIQQIMVPVLLAITAVSVVYGELNLRKQRSLCNKILRTEDEECDRWEYEEEKAGAYGTVMNLLSQILCVLVLSAGYSLNYIENGHSQNMLAACLIFLACYAYDGFWQVRFVKVIQTAYPEKQGDPSSRKFQQQWLDSCDEAEKELIYKSAYRSYICITRTIPGLLLLTMLGHLFFNTGIMAITVVAVVWLVVTLSYLVTCVNLKKNKLR